MSEEKSKELEKQQLELNALKEKLIVEKERSTKFEKVNFLFKLSNINYAIYQWKVNQWVQETMKSAT